MHVAPVNHTEELRFHHHRHFHFPPPHFPPSPSLLPLHQAVFTKSSYFVFILACVCCLDRVSCVKAFNLRCTGHSPSQPPRIHFHYAPPPSHSPSLHLVHTMPSFFSLHLCREGRGEGGVVGRLSLPNAQTHAHPRPLPVAPIASTDGVSAARAKNPFCVRYSHINCVVISQSNS